MKQIIKRSRNDCSYKYEVFETMIVENNIQLYYEQNVQ